jgi:hypothetical protein
MTVASEDKTIYEKSARFSDSELLDLVQRQTFNYFWEGAHPGSGLARDRIGDRSDPQNDSVTIGGSGFGVMAIIVASERGWITRAQASARLSLMLDLLERATCFHGHFPHFMNGRTGAAIPFSRKDDGGDLVETSFLFQGLLCARQYFSRNAAIEKKLRERITRLWLDVEWSWHTQGGRSVLTWHWSPNNGFSLAHEIRGWNECLMSYVLAAGSPNYAIDASVYHKGWAQSRDFMNGRSYYGIEIPLGPAYGGDLSFSHYSFCGLDPRGLTDDYADYWQQTSHHVAINIAHCVRNPGKHKGYGLSCWGLTASDDPKGYRLHAPGCDNGVITPSAALSSFPYAPEASSRALRYFYEVQGARLWGRYGFTDAFRACDDWYAKSFLAIDQGPIVIMIENHRSGLLWNLFMKDPDVQAGLRRLGFHSPHLN